MGNLSACGQPELGTQSQKVNVPKLVSEKIYQNLDFFHMGKKLFKMAMYMLGVVSVFVDGCPHGEESVLK